MAKAIGSFEPRTVYDGVVKLELSYDEARCVKMVLGSIAGNGEARKHTDAVYDALDKVIEYYDLSEVMACFTGTLSAKQMPREANIQRDIIAYLRGRGCYVYNAGGSASSAKGTADLLVCYRGRFLALELKRADGSYGETRQQAIRRRQVEKAEGTAAVATSIPEVAAVLRLIDERDLEDTA